MALTQQMRVRMGAVAVAATLVVLGGWYIGDQARQSASTRSSGAVPSATRADAPPSITHGPMLGRPSATGMGIWVRTSAPAAFEVRYHPQGRAEAEQVATGRTRRARDNTGQVHLTSLQPDTRYVYRVRPAAASADTAARSGTFRTLPSASQRRHAEHNPEGLFNFSFEIGACNFQYRRGDTSYAMPAYRSMRRTIEDEVDFQIMNGDYIYEARRGTSVDEWRQAQGVPADSVPEVLRHLPDVAGMWANYRLYLERSTHLKEWHRHVPAYFMFDDHELLNDINGAGTPGRTNRRTLARDPGVRAWNDYVGWSNPLPDTTRPVRFGRATIGSDGVLTDPDADFQALHPPHEPTLHVHGGDHPARGVYAIEEVLGPNRVQLRPAPEAGGDDLVYTIGRRSYFDFRVSNAHFLVLDTRSHRDVHDKSQPAKEGVQMLGARQQRWVKRTMRVSDADVFFVVSTVSLTIPHVSPSKPNKDESWTSYLDAREDLIDFWDGLGAPVLVLTGDLHNSMAIGVTDNVREYIASPHNSPNHSLPKEGDRPPSGPFDSNGRPVDIHWSSFWMDDVPGTYMQQPYYTVVAVKNTFKNPGPDDPDRRVAYPTPRVIIRYYDGLTGDLAYAESVALRGGDG
jgi:phosphodiesterase/alkaline phosphatase D-like protein